MSPLFAIDCTDIGLFYLILCFVFWIFDVVRGKA